MFKKAKHLKNQKGLTLVELLAVIVILAIIAAIAVPSIGNIIDNSRYSAAKSDALNVLNAANIYFVENSGEVDVTVKELVDGKYLDTSGKIKDKASTTDTIKKNAGGNTITTDPIKYSGNYTVEFAGATIDSINADPSKGSSGNSKKITGTPPTTGNNDITSGTSG